MASFCLAVVSTFATSVCPVICMMQLSRVISSMMMMSMSCLRFFCLFRGLSVSEGGSEDSECDVGCFLLLSGRNLPFVIGSLQAPRFMVCFLWVSVGVAGSLMRLGGLVMTDGARSLWVLDDVLVSEEELVCCVSCESVGSSWGEFCEVSAFSQ